MKNYYYSDNEEQFGPFTLDELKPKRLKKSTLVWTDGLIEWARAETFEELKDILVSEPPPLPKKELIKRTETITIKQTTPPDSNSSYDPTYKKETDATFAGIFILIIPIVISLTGIIKFNDRESYEQARMWIGLSLLVVRICVTIWVVNIANRQNRNSSSWGWFAFFLPGIALIVIGQLKKLRLEIEIDGRLPVNQQVSVLLEKANQIYSDNRYEECIEILNKLIELDNHNDEAIKLRAISYYYVNENDKAAVDFNILHLKDKFPSSTNYYLGNLEIKKHNREKAIEFWRKAKENGNENAQTKLDLYHTFTGKYILDSSTVKKKVYISQNDEVIYFEGCKYAGGIPEIDNHEKFNKMITQIIGYDNGLDIELRKTFKAYHIALAYYEIDDIVINETDNFFKLQLSDYNTLTFNYDEKKDYNKGLKNLCGKFKQATGKTPSADTSLTK